MTSGNAVSGNAASGTALLGNVVLFGRMLGRAGLSVDPDQTRRFADVLGLLGFDRRDDVKAAGRAVFVRRREERGVYDAAFDLFWRRTAPGGVSQELPRLRQVEQRADTTFTAAPEVGEAVEVGGGGKATGGRRARGPAYGRLRRAATRRATRSRAELRGAKAKLAPRPLARRR